MNKIFVHGRLTRDVDLKTTQSGISLAVFTIASDEGYGENKKTEFIDCKAWRGIGETINKFFKKGKEISIFGVLESSTYEKDDEKRKAWCVRVEELIFHGDKANSTSTDNVGLEPIESVNEADLPF